MTQGVGFSNWGFHPIMENLIGKKMENQVEAGFMLGLIGIGALPKLGVPFSGPYTKGY